MVGAAQKELTRRRLVLALLLGGGFVLLLLLDLLLGTVWIPLGEMWEALVHGRGTAAIVSIARGYRLPKACTSVLVGAALSVSGLLMQTVFRNPLAGPYVLGVSSGASLGAAVALLLPFGWGLARPSSLVISACLGGLVVLLLILIASVRLRGVGAVLILGIMLSAMAGAIVSILQVFSAESALRRFVLWSMGSMAGVRGEMLGWLFGAVLLGLGLAVLCARPLNLLLLGRAQARQLGLSLGAVRICVFVATSVLAGAVTACCGPIGFVGVAVPHLARWVFGTARQGVLLFASMVLGAEIMLLADIVSGLPGAAGTLPINAVTALLGLPIIFYLLLRKPREWKNASWA